MYTSHFGLTAKPFSIVPDPNVLFLSKNHENALTYLEYGLTEKVGFILLTGEVGIGKTTLIRHLINKMSPQMDIGVIFNTNFSSEQLFRRILSEFELPCDTADKSLHLETLYHFLIEQFARKRHTLLIIDEAQNLSDEVLEDIRMLFNLQTDRHILLQIILVGQPDLKRRMSSPNLRQLAQRIVVNFHLSPMSKEQTGQYINYRLRKAGATADLFTAPAMALIHEASGGIPRAINLICDTGLVYGYGEDKLLVDREIIENVLKDRICLTAAAQAPPLPADGAPPRPEATDGLADRITAIEAALADLQIGQEKFMEEIRTALDQRLRELKAEADESVHSHPKDEKMDDQPVSYTFTDSAAAHSLEFDDKPYPGAEEALDPEYRFEPRYAASKPDPLKTIRKTMVPYLDTVYTWARRTLSHRYALWIILIAIPLFGLWALVGGNRTPSVRFADPSEDSTSPTALVSMNDTEPSPEMNDLAGDHKPEAAPVENEKTVVIHTIRPGETLLSIAKHYGVRAEAIKSENHLRNSHLIYVGQTLNIPSPASTGTSRLEIK